MTVDPTSARPAGAARKAGSRADIRVPGARIGRRDVARPGDRIVPGGHLPLEEVLRPSAVRAPHPSPPPPTKQPSTPTGLSPRGPGGDERQLDALSHVATQVPRSGSRSRNGDGARCLRQPNGGQPNGNRPNGSRDDDDHRRADLRREAGHRRPGRRPRRTADQRRRGSDPAGKQGHRRRRRDPAPEPDRLARPHDAGVSGRRASLRRHDRALHGQRALCGHPQGDRRTRGRRGLPLPRCEHHRPERAPGGAVPSAQETRLLPVGRPSRGRRSTCRDGTVC